jgi:uncharacterized membrane protein
VREKKLGFLISHGFSWFLMVSSMLDRPKIIETMRNPNMDEISIFGLRHP